MNGDRRSRSAALLALALATAALLAPFRARDWRLRIARLPAAMASSSREPQPGPSAFSFDPRYAVFVEALRRATPEDATIALSIPRGELYVYEAAYRLAPRRIAAGNDPSASFVAHYSPEVPPERATPLPGGFLEQR